MAPHDDLREVVLQAEAVISEAIFSTAGGLGERFHQVGSASDALFAAAEVAKEGRRAAVALAPAELFGALEAIHSVARARAPITIHVVGGPPLGLGRDELPPALDLGAGVLVTWCAQDTVDLALAARRAAEDSETPFLIFTDGGGPVMSLPGNGLVDKFLGPAPHLRPEAGARAVVASAPALARKRAERSFAGRVPFALAGAVREIGELTGRPLAPVERYETADAEEIVVAVGGAFPAARAAASSLRCQGRRVGAVGIRALRPFYASDAVKAVARARAVAVLEPLDVALAPAGPLAQTIKAAFADALTWAPGFPGVGRVPPIVSVVFATLPGEVGEAAVLQALAELSGGDRAKRLLVFGSEG